VKSLRSSVSSTAPETLISAAETDSSVSKLIESCWAVGFETERFDSAGGVVSILTVADSLPAPSLPARSTALASVGS